MSFFKDSPWREEPEHRLAVEEIRYHRRVLELHANDPETGACPICHVAQCQDWRSAFDNLAVAGEVMGEPGQWDGEREKRQGR